MKRKTVKHLARRRRRLQRWRKQEKILLNNPNLPKQKASYFKQFKEWLDKSLGFVLV